MGKRTKYEDSMGLTLVVDHPDFSKHNKCTSKRFPQKNTRSVVSEYKGFWLFQCVCGGGG